MAGLEGALMSKAGGMVAMKGRGCLASERGPLHSFAWSLSRLARVPFRLVKVLP